MSKWQLLKAVEGGRELLGLKGTSIAVLRAALSYIRSDDISESRHETHVCFASNAGLAKRAHVSVQTVERHIAKLVKLGLLSRVASGNGKRWARRDAHGRIVFASGLSVLPLQQRHEELVKLAEQQQTKTLELAVLRDTCMAKLSELVEIGKETAGLNALKTRARNLLRRKPNSDALAEFLAEIEDELAKMTAESAEELKSSDQHIEGHKETSLTQSVQRSSKADIQVSQRDMHRSFPKLCAELRFAPSQQACQRHMDNLAQQLGLGSLWSNVLDLGPALSFMVLGYLLERVDRIQNPRAYAWRLLTDLEADQVEWQSLLNKPRRQSHKTSKAEVPSSRGQLREATL